MRAHLCQNRLRPTSDEPTLAASSSLLPLPLFQEGVQRPARDFQDPDLGVSSQNATNMTYNIKHRSQDHIIYILYTFYIHSISYMVQLPERLHSRHSC